MPEQSRHRRTNPSRTHNRRNRRFSPSRRGYGNEWRRIRAEVLRAHGVPRDEWPQWDVDHRPAYDPAVEPDHLKYTLVPMRHAEHSKKTARFDGAFGRRPPGRRARYERVEQPDTVVRTSRYRIQGGGGVESL